MTNSMGPIADVEATLQVVGVEDGHRVGVGEEQGGGAAAPGEPLCGEEQPPGDHPPFLEASQDARVEPAEVEVDELERPLMEWL
ncbi:hypothetical protein QFZ63_002046 [Streptomyces sp. B3I7]|uniref:hypothetical protein n=1 Tax=Streptomyces sp. B3I7 TaxID=3042269 RepID=UPI00277E2297|nr:hypothetical protein [Streptomyces sp. B3I7]MDQ0810332.1 hypothetical protein [Streptomyces sp. B3I7]